MKMKIGLGVIVLSTFGASLAYGASIVGSKHDMTLLAGAADAASGRVCAYCHTPHHANVTGLDYAPLWSHTISAVVYTEYSSSTLDATIIDPLTGNSRLCMSCHDGTIAVDQHYNFPGSLSDIRAGDSWGGIDVGASQGLSNDHPVGFDYAAVAGTANDAGLIAPKLAGGLDMEIRGTGTILPDGRTISDLLEQRAGGLQIMTCGSCHDVHGTSSGTNPYFLIASPDNSAICLTCHIK